MRLPLEVSEAVIDQSSDDTASLRNLSLTCATFLPRSRYHLFSSICVRTVEQMESSRDFLDAHPGLLPLVRRVTLSIVSVNEEPDFKSMWWNVRGLDVVPVDFLTRLPNVHAWTMETGDEKRASLSLHHSALSIHHSALSLHRAGVSFYRLALSLHRSALSLYRRYSSHIQRLDLCNIYFDRLSDFSGLISAFTSIHTLICSQIGFRHKEQHNASLYVGGTSLLRRPLQVSTLIVSFCYPINEVLRELNPGL